MDDRPETITIPTELERGDAWKWVGILASVALAVDGLWQNHVPLVWSLPLLLLVGIDVLTVPGVADIPFVGSIASVAQSLFGYRQAHDWLLAVWHWLRVTIYPNWSEACVAFCRLHLQRTMRWLERTSARTPWLRSRLCSWASAIRSRLSRHRAS